MIVQRNIMIKQSVVQIEQKHDSYHAKQDNTRVTWYCDHANHGSDRAKHDIIFLDHYVQKLK